MTLADRLASSWMKPLLDKAVVVTGANRGIGRAVAAQLAAQCTRVVLVARDAEGGEHARKELAESSRAAVELVVGDLGCVAGMHRAARAIAEACPRIDVLVHNAGLWPTRLERNEDGHERSFAVNHLAPFVLNLSLERTLLASRARVVQVSAGLYVKGRPDPERTPAGEDFRSLGTYPTTKLCNLLLVPRFAERWRGTGLTINAVHPGVIRTGLGDRDGAAGVLLRFVKRFWKLPAQGAAPVTRLALHPSLDGVSGRYFHLDAETALLPLARDEVMAKRLWDQALAFTGLVEEPPPHAAEASAG